MSTSEQAAKPKRNTVRLKTAGSTQGERDRIALGRIEAYMDSIANGYFNCPTCQKKHKVKEIPPAIATILRARYDKLRPTLSAVEQTMVDPRDKAEPADLEAKLRALFDAKPELFAFIKPVCAAPLPQPEQPAQTQH